jgi:hypothetical protein
MFRPSRLSRLAGVAAVALTASGGFAAAAPKLKEAPNLTARPVDQLSVSGNACGPAALLTAFRFGSAHWQRAANGVPGNDDHSQLRSILHTRGRIPSAHLQGRMRWSRDGVNLADLVDIANEMCAGHDLPRLDQEIFFTRPGEDSRKLLARVHRTLATSLDKGFPAVLSIRRFAHRNPDDGAAGWVAVEGHFVTMIALPRKLHHLDRSFPVTYLDPWGAKRADGWIAIPDRPILAPEGTESPCLEAIFPAAQVGKKAIRKGEFTALTLAGAISRR